MIGSEGTLGVITKVIFRLYPKFGATATLIVPYDSRHDAINTVPKILQKGIIPLALEYVERDSIEKSAKHLSKKWPGGEGNAFLMIIVTGADLDEVYSKSEKISATCQENGSLEPLIAESREEQDRILDIRSNIYTALKPDMVDILDVTVPPANMGKLMDAIDGIAEKYDAYLPMYGHAGDGNLHAHLMKEEGKDPEHFRKLKDEIYSLAIGLGGTITGEHGIGKIRIEDLHLCLSEKEIQLMEGINVNSLVQSNKEGKIKAVQLPKHAPELNDVDKIVFSLPEGGSAKQELHIIGGGQSSVDEWIKQFNSCKMVSSLQN
jgi:glycolate oxidase